MRLKLIVSYDGTRFAGWQCQPGKGTVQDLLQEAFSRVAGERIIVHGSGRTDAGVHARGQCAHVDVPDKGLEPRAWLRAINGNLPAEIRILSATRASSSFHARYSAKGKTYQYLIHHGEVLPPLDLHRVWKVHQKLDLDQLRAAAALFVGEHDFAAFAANRGEPLLSTRRRIHSVKVHCQGQRISLSFTGEGFLYKMVRMLTGAIVYCASERASLDDIRRRLENGGPKWTHVAPASGLYLMRVFYRSLKR